jgi:uncharacterized protein YjbJ (UPF0337 family)
VKQGVGDLTGNESLRQEGRDEEQGEAKVALSSDEVRAAAEARKEQHARENAERSAQQADQRATYLAGKAQRPGDKYENPERRTGNCLG